MRYKEIPDRPYEFVYIDGHGTSAPSDGAKVFDFDFIRVVEKSKNPIYAIVDTRMSACWAFQNIFKEGTVVYDHSRNIGLIGPCTKDDLLTTNGIIRKIGPHPVKRLPLTRNI